MPSHWQLVYYIRLVFICQELFQNFFRSFWSRSFKNQTFLTAVSFETAYLLYQTEIRLSRTFFVLFKPLFRSTAAPLSDSFNRIPQHSPSCQQKFSGFFKFRNRDISPIAKQSPKFNSVDKELTIAAAIPQQSQRVKTKCGGSYKKGVCRSESGKRSLGQCICIKNGEDCRS